MPGDKENIYTYLFAERAAIFVFFPVKGGLQLFSNSEEVLQYLFFFPEEIQRNKKQFGVSTRIFFLLLNISR